MQAAVPTSATFAVPFSIRPDPDKESSFWLSVVSSFSTRRTNHIHVLVVPSSAQQLSDFLCLVRSQVAKEVQKLCDWTGGIFDERCTVTPVTNEPEAQIARLKYGLSQGLKEGLVPHPKLWPGIQSATALSNGSMKLKGKWVRRTELYDHERTASRRRRKITRRKLSRLEYNKCVDILTLELSAIPCWADLSKHQYAKRVRALIDELLIENADVRKRVRKDYRKRLTNPDLFCFRPKSTKKGVQPLVHSFSYAAWIEHIKNWEAWRTRYAKASARLRQGIAEALNEFPEQAFIPSGIWLQLTTGLPPP